MSAVADPERDLESVRRAATFGTRKRTPGENIFGGQRHAKSF